MTTTPAVSPPLQGLLVVALANYQPRHKSWGWLRLAQGLRDFSQVPGLRFAKVMGSGHGGGFSLRPSSTHQGLIALLDDAACAQAFLEGAHVQAMRDRSRDFWSGLMAVDSARGAWDGQDWAATPPAALGLHATTLERAQRQPVAVLTRASIRPAQALTFWRHAPATQTALYNAPGCMLAMGLGEAPLLRQCTFSLWRTQTSMLDYAQGAAHGRAAQTAWQKNFFTESLFLRMRLLAHEGHWQQPQPA